MTVASGSPAFEHLVASEDAFTVEMLKNAGAVVIGKTNMPPMAAGGMQRGVYGRAESPYNQEYLTAAFASGSSNGSATSTAASFAAFAMAEETVSSGRSPASNYGLVAYTPSRGVISIRGNWPLYPTCDAVVPHARTTNDMLNILDVIVRDDLCTKGDFWREQPFISLAAPSKVRPSSYQALASPNSLQGKRIGVPKMYIGQSNEANRPINTHQSILDLWHKAKKLLEAQGATVIETDFPVMEKYDSVSGISRINDKAPLKEDRESGMKDDGLTEAWNAVERCELVAYAWDDFLTQNQDPNCPSLASVDWKRIFPTPFGALPDRYINLGSPIGYSRIVDCVKHKRPPMNEIPGLQKALETLENRRKVDFEDWLEKEHLDSVVFPTNADVGRADSDVNPESAERAWQNGVLYSNGNRVIRHLGIPTVTVTMGIMEATKMPVGLTFAAKAYEDNKLLDYAFAYENASKERKVPGRTPALDSDFISCSPKPVLRGRVSRPSLTIAQHSQVASNGQVLLTLRGTVQAGEKDELESLNVHINGQPAYRVLVHNGNWEAEGKVSGGAAKRADLEINKIMVVVMASGKNGQTSASLLLLD